MAMAVSVAAMLVGGCSDDSVDPAAPGGGAGGGGVGGSAAGGSAVGGDGAFVDGATWTLQGEGFGDKPRAGPILYDDFEQGAVGAELDNWDAYGNTAVRPVYDGTKVFAGLGAALIDFPDGTYSNGAHLGGLGLTELYFSYRVYVHDGGGSDPNPQLKFGRATSGAIDLVHGSPGIGMTLVGTFEEGGAIWYQGGSEVPDSFYGHTPSTEQWARVEHYLKLSDPPGAANGKRYAKLNLQGGMTFSGFPGGHFADPFGTGVPPEAYDGAELVTLTVDADAERLENVLLPFFTRSGQLVSVWVDEVYVDDTHARVELGDAPAWNDCTERSPQPAASWSDTSITIDLNQGRLTGEAYAFVVTTEGTIIELGSIGSWL